MQTVLPPVVINRSGRMTDAEMEAWKAKKKAEGKWVENPTDEQNARWADDRKRKDEGWEKAKKA